jgi:hypothetical protein
MLFGASFEAGPLTPPHKTSEGLKSVWQSYRLVHGQTAQTNVNGSTQTRPVSADPSTPTRIVLHLDLHLSRRSRRSGFLGPMTTGDPWMMRGRAVSRWRRGNAPSEDCFGSGARRAGMCDLHMSLSLSSVISASITPVHSPPAALFPFKPRPAPPMSPTKAPLIPTIPSLRCCSNRWPCWAG